MVTTFETSADGLRRVAEHDAMRAATAELPAGVYTTFRTYQGNRVLRLGQQVHRLAESAALSGFAEGALDEAAIRRALAEILGGRSGGDWRFRLIYAPPRLFYLVEPFLPYPPDLYDEGVRCITLPLHRDIPEAKRTAFIWRAAEAYDTLPAGVHEGLMVAEDGALLEGLTSNFLAVTPPTGAPNGSADRPDQVLRTEMARVLAGVTRCLVIEAAAGLLPVSDAAIHLDELPHVRECFITSASREILPVVRIDDRTIGDGRPGPMTRALMARFHDLVDREAVALC
jgi:branched-subunit amino acid aminotransferase/4-amino-4-deoxychorismate lyase